MSSKLRIATSSFALIALLAGGVYAAENLASGPQVGQEVPGPFHPLNLTGEAAGEKLCLYCKNGSNPVAMIFARQSSDSLAKLIKKIDETTAKNKDAKMGSFVVFLSDSEDLGKEMKTWADKEKISTCVLSIDNPSGPKGYNVAKEADVTVVLYTDHKVKANFAFAKGQLKDKNIDEVVSAVSKILPQ